MAKSIYAKEVDEIQKAIRPLLKARGFRVRGRTFNRITQDDLTQVVNIQMGASDPPGATYIPGFRENLHGLFTINLGVYVPEVAKLYVGGEPKSWIQDYHCCVRARFGDIIGEKQDIWWHARNDNAVIQDVRRCLNGNGFPFLDRYSTRDKILSEWCDESENFGASSPPRIVMAIILAKRNQKDRARALLSQQVLETRNPGHPEYVRKLAAELELGSLDG